MVPASAATSSTRLVRADQLDEVAGAEAPGGSAEMSTMMLSIETRPTNGSRTPPNQAARAARRGQPSA